MLTNLEKSILATLAYFDIFDFPLTKQEIWHNLWLISPQNQESIREEEYAKALERLVPQYLQYQQGFFSLDKNKIAEKIQTRKSRYLNTFYKNKIALRNARRLARLPFIKAIFLCNNLAYNNAQEKSDIDFLIVTKPTRLFTARFLSTALMASLNKRPKKEKKPLATLAPDGKQEDPGHRKNKICLSFWLAEDNLNLIELLYPEDIYLHFWLKQLVPLYDPENILERIWQANLWFKLHLPNATPFLPNDLRKVVSRRNLLKKFAEKFLGNWFEKKIKSLQLKILPETIKQKAKENNSDVVIDDKLLKFHTNDRRIEFRTQWQERCQRAFCSY